MPSGCQDNNLESFSEKTKKMCVVSTGCVRPSPERVYQNIINTIDKIESYDYDFYILTYETDDAKKLKSMLDKNNIKVKFFTIPFIEESIGNERNGYRMFKKNELLLEKIQDYDKYDLVFRHRLDTSLQYLEIDNIIEEDVYYTPLRSWQNPFDLSGYAKPKQFKKIWSTVDTNFNVYENEEILKNQIFKNNIKIKPFNIKLILYQGNEEKHLGIPQWSKGNRIFEYKNGWVSEGLEY